MPIEEYSVSPTDYTFIQNAKIALVNKCLKDLGSDYSLPSMGDPVIQASRRYGIMDYETASKYGYHMPPEEPRADGDANSLSADERRLIFGELVKGEPRGRVPSGGCYGEAESVINGPNVPDSAISFASQVNGKSFEDSLKDPRLVKINKKWARCMAREGYEYETPMQAVSDSKFQKGDPGEEERRVAMADVNCKDATSLIEIWSEIESERQVGMIQENVDLLNRLKAFQNLQKRNALKVITTPGG
ncbi:hypothetical protein [Streptomyces sp. MMS24-I29]|uniref:hypothetical protein n=1 Tax=Streptomyces sp. MMS24-I29 TaxID=3351480 RepID=UPI003C7D58BC